jgi:hypothetical protein
MKTSSRSHPAEPPADGWRLDDPDRSRVVPRRRIVKKKKGHVVQDPTPLRLSDFIRQELEAATDPNAARNAAINELFYETSKRGVQGWAYLANCLFFAIARHEGPDVARPIFNTSGPSPKRLLVALDNAALLERYDNMRPKPIVAKLAREVAEENKRLPRAQQRGAMGTDARALEDLIRDLLDKRARRSRAAT